jgi:hypothetical protein
MTMDSPTRGRIAGAVVLIGLGVWFLAVEFSPVVWAFAYGSTTWPFTVLGVAAYLLVVGVLTWTPGLVIPACILAGLGGLLYYQNLTGNWESWAYAWTLIPGLVGLGLLLFGLMRGRPRGPWLAAAWLLAVSAGLFVVFGSFLGGPGRPSQWWPVVLILLGVLFLAQSFARRRPA